MYISGERRICAKMCRYKRIIMHHLVVMILLALEISDVKLTLQYIVIPTTFVSLASVIPSPASKGGELVD